MCLFPRWKPVGLLLCLALVVATPSRAWDRTGHEVAAYIAWQQMTPEARAEVSRILAMAPPPSDLLALRPSTGASAGMVQFVRAAYWPDIVRDRDRPERYEKYHRGAWHYTNIFWERTTAGGVRIREDLQPADENVVERLYHLEQLARHDLITSAQKAVLIAWLEHLVGDLHQPLHTSARVTAAEPEGDRGGNLFGLDEDDNLHWYWDRALSDAFEQEVGESQMEYVRRIATSIMHQHPPVSAGTFDYESWAERGFELASRNVYADLERGVEPSVAYAEMTQAEAAAAVAAAGYRLGALMNDIFG